MHSSVWLFKRWNVRMVNTSTATSTPTISASLHNVDANVNPVDFSTFGINTIDFTFKAHEIPQCANGGGWFTYEFPIDLPQGAGTKYALVDRALASGLWWLKPSTNPAM